MSATCCELALHPVPAVEFDSGQPALALHPVPAVEFDSGQPALALHPVPAVDWHLCEDGMASRRVYTFTNSDLTVGGYLTLGGGSAGYVTHSLSRWNLPVVVTDNVGQVMTVVVVYDTVNRVTVYLGDFMPITGTWRIAIGG